MTQQAHGPDPADIAAIRRAAEQVARGYRTRRLRGFVQDLAVEAGWRARGSHGRELRYGSLPELVLALGGTARSARSRVLDWQPHGAAGSPGSCYANAATIALSDSDFVYVEGYAQSLLFPVPHAWCVHLPTGQIVDPTWASSAVRTGTGRAHYLGVRFAADFVRANTGGDQPASLLESDWQRGFRALRYGFVTDSRGIVIARDTARDTARHQRTG